MPLTPDRINPFSDGVKSESEKLAEKRILSELLEVVEQRDQLVAMLEEDRVRYRCVNQDGRLIASMPRCVKFKAVAIVSLALV
jgi:hypothetical protein